MWSCSQFQSINCNWFLHLICCSPTLSSDSWCINGHIFIVNQQRERSPSTCSFCAPVMPQASVLRKEKKAPQCSRKMDQQGTTFLSNYRYVALTASWSSKFPFSLVFLTKECPSKQNEQLLSEGGKPWSWTRACRVCLAVEGCCPFPAEVWSWDSSCHCVLCTRE